MLEGPVRPATIHESGREWQRFRVRHDGHLQSTRARLPAHSERSVYADDFCPDRHGIGADSRTYLQIKPCRPRRENRSDARLVLAIEGLAVQLVQTLNPSSRPHIFINTRKAVVSCLHGAYLLPSNVTHVSQRIRQRDYWRERATAASRHTETPLAQSA